MFVYQSFYKFKVYELIIIFINKLIFCFNLFSVRNYVFEVPVLWFCETNSSTFLVNRSAISIKLMWISLTKFFFHYSAKKTNAFLLLKFFSIVLIICSWKLESSP